MGKNIFFSYKTKRPWRSCHKQDGTKKRPYSTLEAAQAQAVRRHAHTSSMGYECPLCGWYHVGRQPQRPRRTTTWRAEQDVLAYHELGERVTYLLAIENSPSTLWLFSNYARSLTKYHVRGYH